MFVKRLKTKPVSSPARLSLTFDNSFQFRADEQGGEKMTRHRLTILRDIDLSHAKTAKQTFKLKEPECPINPSKDIAFTLTFHWKGWYWEGPSGLHKSRLTYCLQLLGSFWGKGFLSRERFSFVVFHPALNRWSDDADRTRRLSCIVNSGRSHDHLSSTEQPPEFLD